MPESHLATEDVRTYSEAVKEIPPEEHDPSLDLPPSESDGESREGQKRRGSDDKGKIGLTATMEGEPREGFVPNEKDKLKEAGVARPNQAATRAHPEGTTGDAYNREHSKESVLQQHCNFFDRDRDGVIWPTDTFRGFYQLGFGLFLSLLSTVIIHTFFAYPTQEWWQWIPDPLFRIHTERIHRDKHGSDSGSYDNYGGFVPQKFEDFFERYSSLPGKDGLTVLDTVKGIVGQRCVFDPIGWGGASFEWLATWILLWPADGIMKKEDVRGIYDGSIFWSVAKKRGVKF